MKFKNPGLIRTVSLATVPTALLLGSATAATAQELAEAEQMGLNEIIVTAQKRSENLQKVPISIAAFDASGLNSAGISDTRMLQAAIPGLVATNTGSLTSFYLRGVGTRFAFAGLEPSVAIYVDDRYVSRANASAFEFADVERIEVLKGPQGVLYGRNATGGAIRAAMRKWTISTGRPIVPSCAGAPATRSPHGSRSNIAAGSTLPATMSLI